MNSFLGNDLLRCETYYQTKGPTLKTNFIFLIERHGEPTENNPPNPENRGSRDFSSELAWILILA